MKKRNIIALILVSTVTGIIVRCLLSKKSPKKEIIAPVDDNKGIPDTAKKVTIVIKDDKGNIIHSDSRVVTDETDAIEISCPADLFETGKKYTVQESDDDTCEEAVNKIEFLNADSASVESEENSISSVTDSAPADAKFPADPVPLRDEKNEDTTKESDNRTNVSSDVPDESTESNLTDTPEETVEPIPDSEEDKECKFETDSTKGLADDIVRLMLDEHDRDTGTYNFNLTEESYLVNIAHDVMRSPDFPFKDSKIKFTSDVFIAVNSSEKRIVFIVKTEKENKLSYNYLICKVDNGKVVIDTENTFRLVAGFPSLSHVTTTKAELTKGQKEQVKKSLNVLALSYCEGPFTEADKITYLSILKDLKPRKSFAMQKVYKYFYKKF